MDTPDRYSEETGTCYGKNFKGVAHGFFSQFQDSFFYANVIQFILVTLMYFHVGNGKYWHLLFYASVAGFLGALIENSTVAYICLSDNSPLGFPFLIAEIFWASCQFSVPFLNLIKMRAFSNGKLVNVVTYVIYGLVVPYVICRFLIGYERMQKGYLVDDTINSIHGFAFGFLAIADCICTVTILFIVRKHNSQLVIGSSGVSDYIKNSSYTILVAVDIVGFLLSILDIVINFKIIEVLPSTITVPFQCLMSTFILILAVDALLFKYDSNVKSSIMNSNNNASINVVKSKNSCITLDSKVNSETNNIITKNSCTTLNAKYTNTATTNNNANTITTATNNTMNNNNNSNNNNYTNSNNNYNNYNYNNNSSNNNLNNNGNINPFFFNNNPTAMKNSKDNDDEDSDGSCQCIVDISNMRLNSVNTF